VGEQKLRIPAHADAVVPHPVQEDYVITERAMGMDDPGTEDCAIGSGDGSVFEFGVEGAGGLADHGGLVVGEWSARRMESAVGYEHAADGAKAEV